MAVMQGEVVMDSGKVIDAVFAISEAIRSLGSIPAGHLYARVMDKLTLGQFEGIVKLLVGANLVRRESSHMLVWVGPMLEEK